MAKRYKNIGQHQDHGAEPGDEFEADLTEAQERRMIAAGRIEIVSHGKVESAGKVSSVFGSKDKEQDDG